MQNPRHEVYNVYTSLVTSMNHLHLCEHVEVSNNNVVQSFILIIDASYNIIVVGIADDNKLSLLAKSGEAMAPSSPKVWGVGSRAS